MVKAYLVGGYVRDKLLGVKSKDVDYSVEAGSYQEMVEWIKVQGEIYLEQPQYWTVRAHIKDKPPADYVLCRVDGLYSDGRRPDSVKPGTIYDDLARRDFTVNAIALDEESGEYLDPHGGMADLKAKVLRAVGSPCDRFWEDALRILRAIRFAVTKGFKFDSYMEYALTRTDLQWRLRDNVSEERKREELQKCFSHDTLLTLAMLQKYDLLEACFGQRLWLMPTMRES